jgi:hypothetical protein
MQVEYFGIFRDGLDASWMCRILLLVLSQWDAIGSLASHSQEIPPIFEALVRQSRKAVNGRLRLTVLVRPSPYRPRPRSRIKWSPSA